MMILDSGLLFGPPVYCVGCGDKLYSLTHSVARFTNRLDSPSFKL